MRYNSNAGTTIIMDISPLDFKFDNDPPRAPAKTKSFSAWQDLPIFSSLIALLHQRTHAIPIPGSLLFYNRISSTDHMMRRVTNRRVTITGTNAARNVKVRRNRWSNTQFALLLCCAMGMLALYLYISDYTATLELMNIRPTDPQVESLTEISKEIKGSPPPIVTRHVEEVSAEKTETPAIKVVKGEPSPTIEEKDPIEKEVAVPAEEPAKEEKKEEPATSEDRKPIQAEDEDCPFKDSPIYRKVFVYPNHGDVENGWEGDILSEAGKNLTALPRWPFLDIDIQSRNRSSGHYNQKSQNVQYTTELLVREIMINPRSCLRTYDPEEATLFYVPYLPSVEHHVGHDRKTDYTTTVYGQAIMDILDKGQYEGWENHFGLTSKYWKRRKGADHILVFSEPMHGLWHPRSRRGNYHFIHSQKQLTPPIVISVELSTTFVEMYPKCAAKNILVPYPNTDGDWFNGSFRKEAAQLSEKAKVTVDTSAVALPAEKLLSTSKNARPVAQFYSAGHHGTCTKLRKAMTQDYRKCAPSYNLLKNDLQASHYALGMHLSTFCPCPGGDSPSAKRHYDALIAECIPIILSYDFVWPFTNEFDPEISLDPKEFSMRMLAKDYDAPLLNETSCEPLDKTRPGMQKDLEQIPAPEIERLRQGAAMARELYTWYKFDENIPSNPLKEGVLPDGGAAHEVVKMLAQRAAGAMWPACEEELKKPRGKDPMRFKC